MQPNPSLKTGILLLTSVCFLALGLLWPQFMATVKGQDTLATIISTKGTAEWVSRHNLKRLGPQKSQPLRINDSLTTGSDGEMVIRFKKGAEIRLLPSSFVTLIRKANATLLAVRRGEIEVIKEGQGRSVLISQGEQDQPLSEYRWRETDQALWIDPKTLDTIKTVETSVVPPEGSENSTSKTIELSLPPNPTELLAKPSTQSPSDIQDQVRRMISDRLERQKNHLFRCYSQLVQKDKKAKGRLNIRFSVNNSGKVEDAFVTQSEIKDPPFQACLVQIIKRTDFQAFHGQTVSTFLPLRFERDLHSLE
jgi:TonB family protein